MKIKKKIYGETHLSIANTINNMGLLEEKRGHLKKAESYHHKALKIRLQFCGKGEFNDIITSYHSLGAVAIKRKKI